MEEAVKLLSQEMVNEMVKRAEDPEVKESLKGLTIRLIMVATDCPDKSDRQAELVLKDSKFVSFKVGSKPAPSDFRTTPLDKAKFDAKVTSPFGPLVDLVTEKMNLVAAFQFVKIEGDLPKLMTQVEGFVAFLKFLGSLPVEWDK
jgi:hypothetical protein